MEETNNPVRFEVPTPERSSRLLALMTLLFLVPKLIILIPHLVVLWLLGIASFVVAAVAQIAVLFTGHYPQSMHEFVTGCLRWQVRVNAYIFGLTDSYPPFTLR